MKISKAAPADTDSIMELIRLTVNAMQAGGLFQWDENYPSREIITADIEARSLFKLTIKEEIAGIIVLNEEQFPDYQNLKWEDNGGRFLVVHRLCVLPRFQGKGLAKQLMSFTEGYAGKNKYGSIRLDTYTLNQKALALYDSLGYRRAGMVSFRDKNFQCFEKVIR